MRLSSRERGYTPQWDKAARAYRLDHPLCCGCAAMGRVERTTVVDHIIPHGGNQSLFWDVDNWQPSCDWHHNAVKQRLECLYFDKLIGNDDLRLDSPKALQVARDTVRKQPIGLDGWPM